MLGASCVFSESWVFDACVFNLSYLSVILLFVPFFVSLFTYIDSLYFKMFHQLFALIVSLMLLLFFFLSELDILKQSSQHTLYTFTLEKALLGVLALFSSSDALLPLLPVTTLLHP